MNASVESAFRAFVADYLDAQAAAEDAAPAEYVRFEPADAHPTAAGLNASLLFGRVVYRRGGDHEPRTTEPLAVKQTSDEHFDVDYCAVQMVNEIHFFAKLVPLFERHAGGRVPGDLFPPFLFGCARSTASALHGTAIFHDLNARGYVRAALPRTAAAFLDYPHLSLMMRRLGQLHGYSYRAAVHDPERFRFLTNFVPRVHERHCRAFVAYYRPVFRWYCRRLRADQRYAAKSTRLDETVAHNLVDFLSRVNSADHPMAVVCHGDYTAANCLFRYANGAPVDVKMLDLGLWRVSPPVLDLAHVLYVEADQSTRNARWYDLIDDYRRGLADVLTDDDDGGGDNLVVPTTVAINAQFLHDSLYGALIASYYVPRKIGLAQQSPLFLETLRAQHPGTKLSDIPEEAIEMLIENFEPGGVAATEAVLDVFRDMIDRRFI